MFLEVGQDCITLLVKAETIRRQYETAYERAKHLVEQSKEVCVHCDLIVQRARHPMIGSSRINGTAGAYSLSR